MAAKLQCEICGGKLVGKPGGIFECESCGTEYSTEWAKAKIQEIQGTVKVEGTVDVKGTVQVEGPVKVEGAASAQSLIKRGNLALEDGKWNDARKYFDEALNADPENAEAYLGLVMAKKKHRNKEAFATSYIDGQIEDDDNNLKRARQFADKKLIAWFAKIDKELENKRNVEKAKVEEAKRRLAPERERISKYRGLLSAGYSHTVGLKSDGTVVAVGSNHCGQCDVASWKDIVAVSAGLDYTVGLKSDGTVVAVGDNDEGRCDVASWKDIVAVSAGVDHTVGLKSDGTVVAVGFNRCGQCDVAGWKDIVAVSAGERHTVGPKSDGTVVATKYTGISYYGRGDVASWTDIVAISAGDDYTVGLKADGTVVAVGDNDEGRCDVASWKDIVAVSARGNYTVGLKADGTVVAVGKNYCGQCDVQNWKLFKTEEEKKTDYTRACSYQESGDERELAKAASIFKGLKDYLDSAERAAECDRIYKELKAERKKREKTEREAREARERAKRAAAEEKARQERIATLNTEKANLQIELANLKGLFTGRRRKEIEARLAEIDNELKKL